MREKIDLNDDSILRSIAFMARNPDASAPFIDRIIDRLENDNAKDVARILVGRTPESNDEWLRDYANELQKSVIRQSAHVAAAS